LEQALDLQKWGALALHAFDGALQAQAGFRARKGQRRMAEHVAQTFAAAQLGKPENEDTPAKQVFTVIQAGTGVGKSLAYCAPAIAVALARNTQVVVSTATISLQEQLIHKDLPQLAEQLTPYVSALAEKPLRVALAKGRWHYVCRLKLESLATGGSAENGDMFPESGNAHQTSKARMLLYAHLSAKLASGEWDGDYDTLHPQPNAADWTPVAAVRHGCTHKYCPLYERCTYYEQRKKLQAAQVIVTNHHLLLISVGKNILPALNNCLLVLDEAHHLPSTALQQFQQEVNLSHIDWIERLSKKAQKIGQELKIDKVMEIVQHATNFGVALQKMSREVMDVCGDSLHFQLKSSSKHTANRMKPACARLPAGILPKNLVTSINQLGIHGREFSTILRAISEELHKTIRENPENSSQWVAKYAEIGTMVQPLESALSTIQLLLQEATEDAPPPAKWFTLGVDGKTLHAHASPILPGQVLQEKLWSHTRAVVLTSATLNICGDFNFFLQESGLFNKESVTTLEVSSPFNYSNQGRLIVRATSAQPRDVQAFTAEMVQMLLENLAQVRSGALVLFASREQMRQASELLPKNLQKCVLLQGSLPRIKLLATHRKQVAAGLPSILFGMQSFGEGLDLPGALCESLFITKLPFSSPDDPVEQARAEWLRSCGGDPFNALTVPATGIRLAQWVGRAIRSETDYARIYCYDKRLTQTGYGQRLLQGLPAFTLEQS